MVNRGILHRYRVGYRYLIPRNIWRYCLRDKRIDRTETEHNARFTKLKKNRSSDTSIVYTFSSIRNVTVSVCVFISTQTNVYTHTGARFKDVQNYHLLLMILQPGGTISSRHIVLCIRIKSEVAIALLCNLCNNHPFLGDTVILLVKHVCKPLLPLSL